MLLHALPAVGAVAFVVTMFLSIWLRNFGARARGAGPTIATPLVALLVVPAPAAAPGGPLVDLAFVIAVGIVSLAFVTAVRRIAPRVGATNGSEDATPEPNDPVERRGLSVPTRMALQMAVALSAAFVAGSIVFPGHWAWTVLTAFIVCSAARGRGDAAYKGVLRLAGAFAGTLAAATLAHVWAPAGLGEAALIFAILFAGVYLREVGYAYWAGCMTLILAMLSRSSDGVDLALLGVRFEAILTGAVCAVAAAWFVFPIRTEAVIRRRLAGVLRALDDLVAPATLSEDERSGELASFERRMSELENVAPPVRLQRRIFGAATAPEHPARWIDLASDVRVHARGLTVTGGPGRKGGAVRRAIGASRRALANHGNPDVAPDAIPVSVSLDNLREALTNARAPQA